MSNEYNTTIYIGVTSNLLKRVWEHKNKMVEGFTSQYHLQKLVYHEFFDTMLQAIAREKQLKSWSRKKKDLLINTFNSQWTDLYETLM